MSMQVHDSKCKGKLKYKLDGNEGSAKDRPFQWAGLVRTVMHECLPMGAELHRMHKIMETNVKDKGTKYNPTGAAANVHSGAVQSMLGRAIAKFKSKNPVIRADSVRVMEIYLSRVSAVDWTRQGVWAICMVQQDAAENLSQIALVLTVWYLCSGVASWYFFRSQREIV